VGYSARDTLLRKCKGLGHLANSSWHVPTEYLGDGITRQFEYERHCFLFLENPVTVKAGEEMELPRAMTLATRVTKWNGKKLWTRVILRKHLLPC